MSNYLDKKALLKFIEGATTKTKEQGPCYAAEGEIDFFLAGVEAITECIEGGMFDADLPS